MITGTEATLVAAVFMLGAYATYQHSVMRRYRMALSLASFALEQAYEAIVSDKEDSSEG